MADSLLDEMKKPLPVGVGSVERPQLNPGVLQMLQQQAPMPGGPIGVSQPQPNPMMQMPRPPPPPPSIGGVPQNFWTRGANGGNAQFHMPQSVLEAVQAGAGGGYGGQNTRGNRPTIAQLAAMQAPVRKELDPIAATNATGRRFNDPGFMNNDGSDFMITAPPPDAFWRYPGQPGTSGGDKIPPEGRKTTYPGGSYTIRY